MLDQDRPTPQTETATANGLRLATEGYVAEAGASSAARAQHSSGPRTSDVVEDATEPTRQQRSRLWPLLRDLAETFVLAVLIFAALRFAVQNTIVQGDSMEPNLTHGQRLLVNKLAFRWHQPQRGDVVVFHGPDGHDRDLIKRVVALPGEEIEIRDGTVYINGRPMDEPWGRIPDHTAFPAYLVPPDHVFVLGDNRPNSNDSRTWGAALPLSRIVGQAWLSIWPADRLGQVNKGNSAAASEVPSG